MIQTPIYIKCPAQDSYAVTGTPISRGRNVRTKYTDEDGQVSVQSVGSLG